MPLTRLSIRLRHNTTAMGENARIHHSPHNSGIAARTSIAAYPAGSHGAYGDSPFPVGVGIAHPDR
ncbi:hypothetical protein ACL02S_09080 [Nocardia sp. 004]|uniref:hypothetical protein n=1 Tax=Nocardia sp. 004 TaxID=3385978 RepID=UPI0039A05FE7